jgi:predicted small secreted protein
MHKKNFQLAWIACVLVAATLACNAISGISQDLRSAKGTAQAAETSVGGLVTQAKGLATEIGGSSFAQTAQAMVTEQGSQILSTGEALATEAEQRGLIKTAQAYATENGSQLLSTGQALATQAAGSGLMQTAQAMATEGVSIGSAPADIPVVPEDSLRNFFGTDVLISYTTSMDYQSVLDFYNAEMVNDGWTPNPDTTVERENNAELHFDKSGRSATVELTATGNETIVVIWITSK